MSDIPPIIVKVKAEVAGFKSDMEKASKAIKDVGETSKKEAKHVESLGSEFKKLRNVAAGAFVFAQLGQMLNKAGHAAVEDAKSITMMTRTITAATGATTAQMDAVNKGIDRLELMSAVADDKIRPAFTLLARSTHDTTKSMDLMELALDVSAGTGKSLTAVTMALSKSMNGSQTALNRIVPEAKNVTDKIGYMRKVFAGAAETASNADPYQRMAVIFDRMYETVGTALIPILNQFADWLQTMIPVLEGFFHQLMDPTTQAGAAWKWMIDSIAAFAGWVGANIGLIIRWGAVLGAVFVAFKIGAGIVAAFRIAVALASIAQIAFNAAMNANPIMLAVTALGLLTLGVLGYNAAVNASKSIDTGESNAYLDSLAAADEATAQAAKAAALVKFNRDYLKNNPETPSLTVTESWKTDPIYKHFLAEGYKVGDQFPLYSEAEAKKRDIAADKAYTLALQKAQTSHTGGGEYVPPPVPKVVTALEAYSEKLTFDPAKFIEAKLGRIEDAVVKKGSDLQTKITEAVTNTDITAKAGDALSAYADREINTLSRIAKARDALSTKYDLAKTLIGSVKEQVQSLMSIENLGTTATSVIQSFGNITDRILTFAKNLKTLKSQNVSLDFVSEIAKAGVEGGSALAQGLVSATPKQVAAINAAYDTVKNASSAASESIAQTVYGDGVDVTKGLLAGIVSQDKTLLDTATTMGSRFAKTFKQASNLALTAKDDATFNKGMAKFQAQNLPATLALPSSPGTKTGDVSIVNNYQVSTAVAATDASPEVIASSTVSAIKFGLPTILVGSVS